MCVVQITIAAGYDKPKHSFGHQQPVFSAISTADEFLRKQDSALA